MKPIIAERITRRLAKNPEKELKALLRRITCEIDFARSLAQAEWAPILDQAEAKLDGFNGDLCELQGVVAKIEESLSPIASVAKRYVIHCVGHGHIDMNWMWSWPETVATTHDTFASALSFMDQYPDFTYSQSQASVYALVEEHYPAMFEDIKRRVKEGRWEVTAAHWVEGDKNLASGEALAHHLLYTRRYFQEKFGLAPEDVPVDWEPDTFGHANTIPTILRQGAVKYYYSCRTGGGHHHDRIGEERPPVFWWQGPDGSKVLVNRETTWYNSYVNIGDNFALPMVSFMKETGLTNWLNVYGIGNHGGGPTREEIDYFIETQSWPIWPTVRFSTSKAYFEAIEAEIAANDLPIPVIDHELNYEFTGCYTSQSAIKRANRFGENYCEEAESIQAVGVKALGLKATRPQDLRRAWINVLFNQFHDILPGSGVAATREHALGLFQETGATTGSIKRTVTSEIARRVDTLSLLPDTPEGREEREMAEAGRANTPFESGAGLGAGLDGFSHASGGGRRFFPTVVYNPCAFERTEIVEAHIYDIDIDPSRIVAMDETGRAVPTMLTYKSPWPGSDWGHTKYTFAFAAEKVPSLGYKTYLLCEGSPNADLPGVEVPAETEFVTPELKIKLDRYNAGLVSVIRRSDGADFASGCEPMGEWNYVTETSRGMTAWVLGDERYPTAIGANRYDIRAASRNEGTDQVSGTSFVVGTEHRMEVPGTESTVKLRTIISGLSPRIDFEAEIDWREIGTEKRGIPGLSLVFESNIDIDHENDMLFETPFGVVTRPSNDFKEVPTLRFAHRYGVVDAAEGGYTLLQDSKYGHGIDGLGLSMRVVRSSFDPDHAPEVGKSKLRYSLVFHETKPSVAELVRLGAAWNHPLLVFPATLQKGDFPVSKSFVQITNDDIVLAGMKLGEDGGLVLRLVNYGDANTEAAVEIDSSLMTGATKADPVDLMERPFEGTASLDGSTVKVTIPANSFASVKVS